MNDTEAIARRLAALERRLALHAWVSLATTVLLGVAIVAAAR